MSPQTPDETVRSASVVDHTIVEQPVNEKKQKKPAKPKKPKRSSSGKKSSEASHKSTSKPSAQTSAAEPEKPESSESAARETSDKSSPRSKHTAEVETTKNKRKARTTQKRTRKITKEKRTMTKAARNTSHPKPASELEADGETAKSALSNEEATSVPGADAPTVSPSESSLDERHSKKHASADESSAAVVSVSEEQVASGSTASKQATAKPKGEALVSEKTPSAERVQDDGELFEMQLVSEPSHKDQKKQKKQKKQKQKNTSKTAKKKKSKRKAGEQSTEAVQKSTDPAANAEIAQPDDEQPKKEDKKKKKKKDKQKKHKEEHSDDCSASSSKSERSRESDSESESEEQSDSSVGSLDSYGAGLCDAAGETSRTDQQTNNTCPICFEDAPEDGEVRLDCVLPCGHRYCVECLEEFVESFLNQGRVDDITCPDPSCKQPLSENVVATLVGDEMLERFVRFRMLEDARTGSYLSHPCPLEGCGGLLLYQEKDIFGVCRLCEFEGCVKCDRAAHLGKTCKAAATEAYQQTEEYQKKAAFRRRLRIRAKAFFPTVITRLKIALTPNMRRCPNCQTFIRKHGGCPHMYCQYCKTSYCWRCSGIGRPHCRAWRFYFPVYCIFLGVPLTILVSLPILIMLPFAALIRKCGSDRPLRALGGAWVRMVRDGIMTDLCIG